MKAFIVWIALLFNSLAFADEWGRDDLDAKSLIDAINESIQSTELIKIKAALKKDGLSESFYEFLKNNFKLVELSNNLKVTGYYEPSLDASLTKSDKYKYPIYRFVEGINNTREEIDYGGALAGKGLEIAYVSDPLKLFFLHIQGSGRLQFDGGLEKHVLYAGNNGAEFFAIGRKLLSEGIITKASMQSVTEYLRKHPERQRDVLSSNPRYIFFKLADSGPVGSLGGTLIPKRSVALDQSVFPSNTLYVLQSEEPYFNADGEIVGYQKFSRFVLNHDSGAAIKGRNRLDYFIGHGKEAELVAGHLNMRGRLLQIK